MRQIKTKYFYLIYDEYGFWFRLFGYGLIVTDRSKRDPIFSIRMGIEKEYRIGKYGIRPLTKI